LSAEVAARHTPGLSGLLFGDDDEALRLIERGQFDVAREPSGQLRFWFVCPGKCKSLTAIALRPVVEGSPQSWQWDGDMRAPTLTPSINHVGCWHGWLTGGVFKEC
jgi:hypothetical protein